MSDISGCIEELKKYTPCDVADACLKLGIDQGYIPFAVQRSAIGKTVVGVAYTVLCIEERDARPPLSTHYIDSAPKDSMVVIGTPPELQLDYPPYTVFTNALYGGLMSTRAKYLGCAGSVVLGNIRDIEEHRRLGYPVFSYGVAIAAPAKRAKVVAINEPLTVKAGLGLATVTIKPGDFIIGDENGVTVLPRDNLKMIVGYMEKRTRADELVAEDIANGVPAAEAQKNRRQGL